MLFFRWFTSIKFLLFLMFVVLNQSSSSSLVSSPNLTIRDDKMLKMMIDNGCKNIEAVIDAKIIEEKKTKKAMKFAVIYSGQVCHGRGALVLYDAIQMNIYWANKNKYLHKPLESWGKVEIFGLFEEMVEGSIAIGGKSGGKDKADGCNNFISLVDWTRVEFMSSEAHLFRNKVIQHGEQRRIEALNRFIGTRWEEYDMILQFRPDVMLRRPITEWGLDFNKINYAHFEGSPRECDPSKIVKFGTKEQPEFPIGFPSIGDPFVFYPRKWTPMFLFYGSPLQGRGSISILRQQCTCCNLQFAKDIHVLDMNSCHNTRSCLYHPFYYLFGEKSCGEKDRPGEVENEYCNPGSMHDRVGLLHCGSAGARTMHRMTPTQFEEFANFSSKYYQPYDKPVELAPCMVNSTGLWCPKHS